MTNKDRARAIRDAIYARSDIEGGAISREQMDEAIESALNKMTPHSQIPVYAPVYVVDVGTGTISIEPGGRIEWAQ